MKIIVIFIVVIVIILVFHIIINVISKENFVSTVQASNDELPVSPNEADKILKYMNKFNILMNYNKIKIPSDYKGSIRDPSQGKDWNMYPYYQVFPIDLNNVLLQFINTKLNDSEFANDKITIIKQPYDIYYKKQVNNPNIMNDSFALSYDLVDEYIFTIDVENTTKMFNSSIIFYSNISNTLCEIIASKNANNDNNNISSILAENEQSYYYKYS